MLLLPEHFGNYFIKDSPFRFWGAVGNAGLSDFSPYPIYDFEFHRGSVTKLDFLRIQQLHDFIRKIEFAKNGNLKHVSALFTVCLRDV